MLPQYEVMDDARVRSWSKQRGCGTVSPVNRLPRVKVCDYTGNWMLGFCKITRFKITLHGGGINPPSIIYYNVIYLSDLLNWPLGFKYLNGDLPRVMTPSNEIYSVAKNFVTLSTPSFRNGLYIILHSGLITSFKVAVMVIKILPFLFVMRN